MQDLELDGATPAHGTGMNKIPVYQTEIRLFSPERTPLVRPIVRVRATEVCKIRIGGVEYDVGPHHGVEVKATSGGRLRIETRADGITCPGLLVWAPFLELGEEFVLYPDHNVHRQLAQTDGAALQKAQDYSGQGILAPEYQNDRQACTKAAEAIGKVLGIGAAAPDARAGGSALRPARAPDTTMRKLRRAASSPVNVAAATAQAALTNFHFSVKDPGKPVLRDGLAQHEIDQLRDARKASAPHGIHEEHIPHHDTAVALAAAVSSSGDALTSLWDLIQRGAARVVDAVVHVVDGAVRLVKATVTAIIDGIEHVVSVIIDSVKKAVLLVQGFLQELVRDIGKAVEWLSHVFDWRAILLTHDRIKNGTLANLQKLKTSDFLGQARSAIAELIESAKQNVDDVFDKMRAGLGQQAFNAHRTDEHERLVDGKIELAAPQDHAELGSRRDQHTPERKGAVHTARHVDPARHRGHRRDQQVPDRHPERRQ